MPTTYEQWLEAGLLPLAESRLLRTLGRLLEAQLDGKYDVMGPHVQLGIARQPFTYRMPDRMVFRSGQRNAAQAREWGL